MEVNVKYPLSAERSGHSSSPVSPNLVPDDMLAAARAHERYLREVLPRDYEMRVFENGSVFLRNTKIQGLERLFTLVEIQKAAEEFRLNPRRTLWQHIFEIWG